MHVTPAQLEWTSAGILALLAYAPLLWMVWRLHRIPPSVTDTASNTAAIMQVVGRARIYFDHGMARTDEKPTGITHIESFENDETVKLYIDQSVDQKTFVVRKEGIATPLSIVEANPRMVRFKLKRTDKSVVM